MAWCEACDRLVSDEEAEEGHCQRCGTALGNGRREPLAWKFRFMIFATVVYLGYRAYQGIAWLMHR
jgi:uncharacterized paraquat-inducible protein A